MDWTKEYTQKRMTPAAVVALIPEDAKMVMPIATGEPQVLLDALAARVDAGQLQHVELNGTIAMSPLAYLEPRFAGKIDYISWFSTAASRKGVQEGRFQHMPGHYHEFPRLHRDAAPYDVFMANVSPMDEQGYFTFSLSADISLAGIECSKQILLEVNKAAPIMPGDHKVHISQVTAFTESNRPLPELPKVQPGPVEYCIAQYIAERIPDGATIQLGIGTLPEAVGEALQEKKHLGVHTELFSDALMKLVRCGAVDNSLKPLHRGKSVATFCMGTKALYDFCHETKDLEMYQVDYVNHPVVLGQLPGLIAVNSCLQVDLAGQVAAEAIGSRHYSGTGGQVDFVRGADLSPGGISFIACPSTALGGSTSRIVAELAPGAFVTTGKNDVDCVVTEYGVASLRGKTLQKRAQALISIAHPDFRDELQQAARRKGLL